jgi:Flp pilus assembly protein TadD
MKMGQVEAAKRNYALAIQQVRKQLSVNDKDGYAVVSLALFQAKIGSLADAKQNLARALALAPEDGDVLANAASIHAFAGETREACQTLTAALEHGFSKVTARHTDEFATLGGCPAYQDLVKAMK